MTEIVRDAESDGVPVIAGSGVRVLEVARAYERDGHSPDEIVSFYPELTLGDVHTALAFYFDNLDEFRTQAIDPELALRDDEEPEFVAYGIGLYVLGEVTVGQAAERAGVSRSRMSELLDAADIETSVGPEDDDELGRAQLGTDDEVGGAD